MFIVRVIFYISLYSKTPVVDTGVLFDIHAVRLAGNTHCRENTAGDLTATVIRKYFGAFRDHINTGDSSACVLANPVTRGSGIVGGRWINRDFT